MARQPAISLLSCVVVMTLAVAPCVWAARQAGEAVLARGVASAQLGAATGRIIGRGSPVFEGDTVTTGPRSIVVLKLDDGSRVTLRPETSFQIEEFSTAENDERAIYRLFKGGLRAVTGFLSKRDPNAVRLRTGVATIGIRGTEFDARLCEDDCAVEAKVRPAPAGRAGFVRGSVIARATNGERARALTAGGPVYNGDVLLTSAGAYAVIAFLDKSRVTLLPDTEFRVDQLVYDEARPEEGRGFFALLRGGLRAVSGAIGKRNRRAYQMRTPVATIGIRGTGYDLYCKGTCINPAQQPDPTGDGLFADVWQDGITADEGDVIPQGSTVFIGRAGLQPVPVPEMPVPFTELRPDEVELPPPPPPAASSVAPEKGLYLSCFTGNCTIETPENTVELKSGQAGYVGAEGGPGEPLDEVPPFQAGDRIYRAVEAGATLGLPDPAIEDGGLEGCSLR